MTAAPAGTADTDTVEVTVPASPVHLSAVRAVAADLAMREDMDLDTIADLRLAVDEACSSLVELALPGSRLRCRFRIEPGQISCTVCAPAAEDSAPDTTGFSWQVLTTLAEHASTEVNRDGDHYLVQINLRKHATR